MYAVTGASGQLGRHVVEALLSQIEPSRIIALVRDPSKVADFVARGVTVRTFDYNAPEGLTPALAGVQRLLLISSNDMGQRERQHRAVIDAAKSTAVELIAYTSILHADDSPIALAAEHRATETAIRESGLRYALLRNSWYLENYTASAPLEIQHGAVVGATGEGRISAASRADYAAAAAAVLTGSAEQDGTYELAGDSAFTLADYAAILAKVSGKPVLYKYLSQEAFSAMLASVGLPGPVASMVAQASAAAAEEALFDDSGTLRSLIGRPTTSLSRAVADALR